MKRYRFKALRAEGNPRKNELKKKECGKERDQ